jgi:benzoate membrane transport protein
LAKPVWISPEFSWSALLGLALPLFVISMASQYLPGIAMIKSYGYKPHVNQLIGWTGLTQVVLAPFGCYSVNIAAISAAVSLDDQVHPDPSKRYIAGISCGFLCVDGAICCNSHKLADVFSSYFYCSVSRYCLTWYD